MATERQIAANRANAARSTGPKTETGKARSRANATRHGMAGESAEVEAGASAEFQSRRAAWAAERPPAGEEAAWALDRAVAASLRIERCERAIDEVVATARVRAIHAWDQDRAVEAAEVAARLCVDPVLASRQLRASLAGVTWLVEAWLGLASALETGRDWSPAEADRALDLLGVAADARSGPTEVDPIDAADPVAFRLRLALEEVDRLEALAGRSLAPLDEAERRVAIGGELALLSKPARLILRYEREAWRRYRESNRPTPVAVAPPPASASASASGRRAEAGGRRAPARVLAEGGLRGPTVVVRGGASGLARRDDANPPGGHRPARRGRLRRRVGLGRRARAEGGGRPRRPGMGRPSRAGTKPIGRRAAPLGRSRPLTPDNPAMLVARFRPGDRVGPADGCRWPGLVGIEGAASALPSKGLLRPQSTDRLP